jgi:hypothetical protein
MTKLYINVSYHDRDMAKRLGARWDPSVKRWYCPPGSALAKIYGWRKPNSAARHNAARHKGPDAVTSSIVADHLMAGGEKGAQLSLLG